MASTVASAASSLTTSLPTMNAVASPDRSSFAACEIASDCGSKAPGTDCCPTAAPPSDHEISAGRMSVAISPGGVRAATTAAAASAPSDAVDPERRIQPDTFAARVSISLWRGASYCWWSVA